MTLRSKTALVLAGLLILAACDESDTPVADDTAGPTAPSPGIESFGDAFRQMFAADPNAAPVDAQSVNFEVKPGNDPFNP